MQMAAGEVQYTTKYLLGPSYLPPPPPERERHERLIIMSRQQIGGGPAPQVLYFAKPQIT